MSTQVPPYEDDPTTRRYGGSSEPRNVWPAPPGQSRQSKSSFLTSEFLVLVAIALAVLIAAAVADNFKSPGAWTLVALLAGAYILSRGLSKIGSQSGPR